jgi:hypothetical protein
METSKKIGIVVLFALGMSIFGYSQYVSASQIGVNITQSELLDENEKGAKYKIELQFDNPSLLLLTAGETEFFLISNDRIIGKGEIESFTLQPLNTSNVEGTFHTDSNASEKSGSISISGIIKYDLSITSFDVPFVYYPTEEQAREFIHQN